MTRAVAFDAMGTLFQLSPLRDSLRGIGASEQTLEAWFGRLLHSAASLTLAGEFRAFAELAETSLRTALAQQDLDQSRAANVLEGFAELPAYRDAEAALAKAREAGLTVALLTNGGEANTRKLLDAAALDRYVDAAISVDEVRKYKPAPEPYLRPTASASNQATSAWWPRTVGTCSARETPACRRCGSIGSSGAGPSRSVNLRAPPGSSRRSRSCCREMQAARVHDLDADGAAEPPATPTPSSELQDPGDCGRRLLLSWRSPSGKEVAQRQIFGDRPSNAR
jgi:2-haloalkanoic acid dehalogenase type II